LIASISRVNQEASKLEISKIFSPTGISIAACKSLLVYTLYTGVFIFESISDMYSSSAHVGRELSMKYKTISASLRLESA